MRNRQTYTVGHLHLILPAIALMNMETLKITRQVVGGTCIEVPILLVVGGGGRSTIAGALVLVIAPATVPCLVPPILANLALGAPTAVAAIAATVASSIVAAIAAVAVTATTLLSTLAVAVLPLLSSLASGTTATWVVGVVRAPGIVGVDRARREVSGGRPVLTLRLLLLKTFEVQHVLVEYCEGNRDRRKVHGGGDGVERRAEPCQHVVDDLIIAKRRTSGSHGVGECLHLLHVLAGRFVSLLKPLNLAAKGTDAGSILGGEHGVNGAPSRRSRGAADELG